jgi:molybdopterin-containing oxidoreductase family iron-sulfur binding subunit
MWKNATINQIIKFLIFIYNVIKQKYWKSVEELENGSIVEALRNNDLLKLYLLRTLGSTDAMSSSTSRRDFLKYVGFSTAAATLVKSCKQVHVLQPEQIIPGVADYYATSVFDGFDFANL